MGWEVLRVKTLKAKYEAKEEFSCRKGKGAKQKTFSWGGGGGY